MISHPQKKHQYFLKIVEAKKFDLIVKGARGLGGIKKLILGSISEAVVHKMPVPVLTFR